MENADRQEALAQFRRAPAGFATRILGIEPQLHQVEILNSVRDFRRTLVYSCNSIGKDFIAGVLTHWWLNIWEEVLVITTAPTGEQVRNIQWKEIRHLFYNAAIPLGGDMSEVEPNYRLGSKRAAIGISTRDESERIQGHHEAHILIIITEGSAVSEEVFLGIRALMASGEVRLLVLANPTRNEGEVWEIANGNRAGWNIIQVNGHDLPNMRACRELGEEHMNLSAAELEQRNECPNPTPYLMTHYFEAETREDFGASSDYYVVHVDGEFGESGSDQLIPRQWVEEAFAREPTLTGTRGGGLDIARSGRDSTAYAELDGNTLARLLEWQKAEVTETEGRIKREVLFASPLLPVAVDDTGLGGGVAPHLAEDFKKVFGIDFSEKAQDTLRFANKPTEMAFEVRRRLDPDGDDPLSFMLVPTPMRRRLMQHLTMPIFKTEDSKGRLVINKKGKSRRSPDTFDALCLALEAQKKFLWSGLNIHQGDTLPEDRDPERGFAHFAGVRGKSF